MCQQEVAARPACRNGGRGLSSPGVPPFLANQERPRPPSSTSFRADAAAPGACCPSMRIEAARTRLELGKGRIMTKIGSFKKVSGEYRGQVITLSVQAKSVRIAPAPNPNGNAPRTRVLIGQAPNGAARTH